jgi:hypothetical protein
MPDLDATVAGAASNSYLTVADAHSFADADLGKNAKAWTEATADEQEAALQRATEEIDVYVGRVASPFDVTAPVQKLLFPRSIDVDPVTSLPYIPARVRRATYLQAAFLLVNADMIDEAASRRARGLVNFSNPDGTGGQIATDAEFGTLHPKVVGYLGEVIGDAVIADIVTT